MTGHAKCSCASPVCRDQHRAPGRSANVLLGVHEGTLHAPTTRSEATNAAATLPSTGEATVFVPSIFASIDEDGPTVLQGSTRIIYTTSAISGSGVELPRRWV